MHRVGKWKGMQGYKEVDRYEKGEGIMAACSIN